MNEVEFIFKNYLVNIEIDGISLTEIIRDIELPMAQEEGHPNLAGDYVVISPRNPKEYFLGKEENHWGDDEDEAVDTHGLTPRGTYNSNLSCRCLCPLVGNIRFVIPSTASRIT